MTPASGGEIRQIQRGSLAEAAGLRVGDRILSVNGHALRDVIDFQFHAAEEELDVVFARGKAETQTVHLERAYGQELGLEFTAPTFDGIRRCRNQCDFCFIEQMPPGLRQSLYVKDDDYRYSFLFGNFVTLTNLSEADWARLAEQRLSPLYVSVHATDPRLRARILGVTKAPDILVQLRRLGALGITVHAQIVIIPELNDGAAVQQTVQDLASLYPTVTSIGLVPVGITRYHTCGLRTVTAQESERIVAWAEGRQRYYRRQLGIGLVYPSDEFYLLAERPVPAARSYDGFPQLANGVGLTRVLLDDWRRTKRRGLRHPWPYRQTTLVCGTLIAPTLRLLAAEMAQYVEAMVNVVAAPNVFFGPTVTVSGLLLAGDVVNSLRGRDPGDLVVLPRAMLDAAGEWTLDNETLADIEKHIGTRLRAADKLSEVLHL